MLDPGALGYFRHRDAVSRLSAGRRLIAMTPLLQWTGCGFSLETGSPRKPSKDNNFPTLILCLRGKEGWGLVGSGVCHASQRSIQVFAVWGLRSRSSGRPAVETWPAPQAARAALPGVGDAAEAAGRTREPGGIAQQTLA